MPPGGKCDEICVSASHSPPPQAIKLPLGIIPAGSGNSMARSLDTPNPMAAALNIIKVSRVFLKFAHVYSPPTFNPPPRMQGKHRPLDILSVRQEGRETLYSHLLAMWGLIADIDIESERFRWAGRLRFDLSGVARVMNLRKYRARLTYLPASQAPPSEPVQATDKTPPIRFQDGTVHNGPPAGWQVSFEF